MSFPEGYGRGDLVSFDFIEHAQDFVFHGQTGRGKTQLAIAAGAAAVSAGKTVRFFGTAGLVLSLMKASREEALDRYLADIEKSDLAILDEFGYIPIDMGGACCSRSFPAVTRGGASSSPPTSSSASGAPSSATRSSRRRP